MTPAPMRSRGERGEFVVVVTGGRDWSPRGAITKLFDLYRPSAVWHGGGGNCDWSAKHVAEERGIPVAWVRAEWKTYGRAAGPIRNRRMLDEAKPARVLCFPTKQSKGTWDCFGAALERGIPCTVHTGGLNP